MIYRNQVFRPVAVGDRFRGWVSRITEDNRIDIALQRSGVAQVRDSAEMLLALLRENGGRLPLNDASDPTDVVRLTQMSKKTFKRAAGMLLKRGAIRMDEQGIEIRK